ncbi:MAG TPA: adenylate/guanylate cyclase domain-containing protein [Solirubrobacterales bacterium]
MRDDRFEGRVGDLLDDAHEAAGQHDWPAVRALAESVLALDPGNETAKRLLEDSRSAVAEEGEWRQLTVMFCDVVGSTTLAAEHDAEVIREVLRAFQTTTNAVVRRYEGHVAKYIGDGLLAYFGYPTPHEDDARRAVQAGLDLLAALRDLAADARQRHGLDLAVRTAIHTGMVVRADMGPPGSPERDAVVGEAPNVAARLQDSARPGTLVISGDTQRLVSEHFVLQPLGSLELRGVSHPVDAFEVIAEAGAGPLDVQRELSPFVDRSEELRRLSALWREVAEGGFGAAAIRGEPGIGKSRLVDELRAVVIAGQGAVLPLRCSTFHATSHLYPARRLLAAVCGINLAADLSEAVPPLRKTLAKSGLEHHLPLFAALLGIPPGPESPAPELDGQRLREATLTALVEWVEAEAVRSALALIVDDLQWADPSTIELLDRLISRRTPRTLVLLTGRSDFELPWGSVEVLDLGPLAASDLDQIAAASPAAQRLAAAQVEKLVRRSDGVPLFFEELLRVEGQPSDTPVPRLARERTAIPPALLDPLLARLAAPGVDLGLVQTVACIGQEVRQDLLGEVADIPTEELQAGLDGLVAAGLLEADEGDASTYRFRHHLLRELAYDTQLRSVRVQRHGRIADALRQRLEGDQSADAGRLAQHLEHAGRTGEAIAAYVQAAGFAQSQGAFAEATEILDHALELVSEIAEEQERLTLELTVRRALGFSMVATLGYTAPQAVYEHERCFELYRALEPGPEHLPDLILVWTYYLLKGDLGRAEEMISVERRRIGAGGPDEPPDELFTAFNRYFRGDVAGAVADLQSYLDSDFAQQAGTPSRWPLPNDPTVAAWALLSLATHLSGDPVAARGAIASAESRAAGLPFPWGPFSMAYAKAYGCLIELLAGDYEAADAEVAELLELAERHGFMFFTLYGQLQNTIATLRQGGAAEADAVTQALALWRIAGGELWVPAFLTEVAKYQLEGGELDSARSALREAEAISRRSGAGYWGAETARVLGETRLAAGDAAGVEELRRAVELAEQQGARVFELRARTSLSRAVGGQECDRLAGLVDAFGDRAGPPELAAARQVLSGEPRR